MPCLGLEDKFLFVLSKVQSTHLCNDDPMQLACTQLLHRAKDLTYLSMFKVSLFALIEFLDTVDNNNHAIKRSLGPK